MPDVDLPPLPPLRDTLPDLPLGVVEVCACIVPRTNPPTNVAKAF